MSLDDERALECCRAAGLLPSAVRGPRLDFCAGRLQRADFDLIVSARFHTVVVGNLLEDATFAVHDGDYYRSKMKPAREGVKRSQTRDPAKVSNSEAARASLGAAFTRP
jgi:hypothetical protein